MSHRKANNSASLLNLIPSNLFSDIEQSHSEQAVGGTSAIIDISKLNENNATASVTDDPSKGVNIVIAELTRTQLSNSVYQVQSIRIDDQGNYFSSAIG